MASSKILKRAIHVRPVMTDHIKLIFTDAQPELLFKLELYGVPPPKAYEANPVLDSIELHQASK